MHRLTTTDCLVNHLLPLGRHQRVGLVQLTPTGPAAAAPVIGIEPVKSDWENHDRGPRSARAIKTSTRRMSA